MSTLSDASAIGQTLAASSTIAGRTGTGRGPTEKLGPPIKTSAIIDNITDKEMLSFRPYRTMSYYVTNRTIHMQRPRDA